MHLPSTFTGPYLVGILTELTEFHLKTYWRERTHAHTELRVLGGHRHNNRKTVGLSIFLGIC